MSRHLLALLPLVLVGACNGQKTRMAMPGPARQCAMCHSFEKGGARIAGPNLFGIIGEQAGTRQGYPFSPAMKVSGVVWTPDTIDAFIAAPQKLIPGTRMAFAGEGDAAKRREIVEYLQFQSGKEKR